MVKKMIGIDPDAKGFQCIYVDNETGEKQPQGYLYTEPELKSFREWVEKHDTPLICIEGKGGQSSPLERFLLDNELVFYSFPPKKIKRFREAVLGEHKNNEKDAQAVAEFGMTMANSNKLSNYMVVDDMKVQEIRNLSRLIEKNTERRTGAINSLWKCVGKVSPELYLTLKGNNPAVDNENNILATKGILNLLCARPNVTEWKNLDDEQMLFLMGGQKYKGRERIIKCLLDIADKMNYVTDSLLVQLKAHAEQILLYDQQISAAEKVLKTLSHNDDIVNGFMEYRGIGIKTACAIRGEMLDFNRFKDDGHLASYGGLVQIDNSTGENGKKRSPNSYNRHLKNALLTAAKNLIQHNGDSHLTGFCKDLEKNKKLEGTELYKRVARAWVRRIFREIIAPRKGGKKTK